MNDSTTTDSHGHVDNDAIRRRWQKRWREELPFAWREDASKEKFYVLEMFPYTSGRMHMGHARNFTMGDIVARLKRAQGYDVLYPMGWDAFGLPAESAALKIGAHPRQSTDNAIVAMRSGMDDLGLSYDWNREIDTSSPSYIAAQQQLFIKFFVAGLVYRDTGFANWCETDQTVLADEQVIEGRCWRCDNEVVKRRVPQWFFDVRRYADELVSSLDTLEGWPSRVRNIQRAWIGRRTGTQILFDFEGVDADPLAAFTTRVDTLMGCTFLLLAPEHRLLDRLDMPEEVLAFRQRILAQSKSERVELKNKEGVDTGFTVRHPLTGRELPVLVANYVLADYGTGAVMCVPAHDQRDLDFARKYGLPVQPVISPDGGPLEIRDEAFVGDGVLINSGDLDGMTVAEATPEMQQRLSAGEHGGETTTFRLQNWSISRQRYWGNPIPIVYCPDHGARPVPLDELPILLPTDVDFMNSGRAILAHETFRSATCPVCGGPAEREVDTMDTFVDSSWYFLRFLSSNASEPFDQELVQRMLPVDLYIGGIEHATLHLIYARFFVKALRDLEVLSFDEPFTRLENMGMVNDEHGAKQSKSKGNITEPSTIIDVFGADALRVYLMFVTAPENPINWHDDGPKSASQYLNRVYRLGLRHRGLFDEPPGEPVDSDLRRAAHRTIPRVVDHIDGFRFNSAVAELMTLTNALYAATEEDPATVREAIEILVKLLAPFAPHLAEELWSMMGHTTLIANEPWPEVDSAMLVDDQIDLVVQVRGKLVQTISVAPGVSEEAVLAQARALKSVAARLDGPPSRVVFVPDRVINLIP